MLDLSKTHLGSSEKKIKQIYSPQTFKVKPHSKATFTEEIKDYRSVINGSVIYPLDLTSNGGSVSYVGTIKSTGEHFGSAFDAEKVMKKVMKNLTFEVFGHKHVGFAAENDGLFLYENGRFFYNVPLE